MTSSKSINFFTVATGKYKDFIVPYITSVLLYNPDAFVEILVDDLKCLTTDIQNLNKLYLGQFKLTQIAHDDMNKIARSGDRWSSLAASLRFVTTPTVLLDYTYIGDVDILVLQPNIKDAHASHMETLGIPFSNMVRKNQRRLTGLHCVRTKDYYSVLTPEKLLAYKTAFLHKKSKILDEHLLYQTVADNFTIPNAIIEGISKSLYRPYHGVHCSPQYKGWYVGNYSKEFFTFMNSAHVQKKFFPVYREWYVSRLQYTHLVYKGVKK